jgi:hypothetical protein
MPIIGVIDSAKSGNLYAASYDSIATVTVGAGGAASATFSSIPTTYTHLQIRYMTRNANVTDTTVVRFNSDTGSNYALKQLRGNGSTVSPNGSGSTTYFELPIAAYSGITASIFGVGIVDILDYANTNKTKVAKVVGGGDWLASGGSWITSGLWNNTTAINRIDILPTSGNLVEYSTFALYGIKVA